jgi:membrane protein
MVQSTRDLWRARVLEWASSIAFYAFLSVFPLFLAMLIVASYLVDASRATAHATDLLGYYLPGGDAEIGKILEAAMAERGRVGAMSLALFLITGRRILGVLTTALNHISDVDEHADRMGRRVAVELALLLGVVALMVAALAAPSLLGFAAETVRMFPGSDTLALEALLGVVRVLLLLIMFALVYACVPRGDRLWSAVFVGALAATALFLITESIFSLLVDRVWLSLRLIYGPLALAALLLSWSWNVALITLVGGGLASHVKVMIVERGTMDEARQRHLS